MIPNRSRHSSSLSAHSAAAPTRTAGEVRNDHRADPVRKANSHCRRRSTRRPPRGPRQNHRPQCALICPKSGVSTQLRPGTTSDSAAQAGDGAGPTDSARRVTSDWVPSRRSPATTCTSTHGSTRTRRPWWPPILSVVKTPADAKSLLAILRRGHRGGAELLGRRARTGQRGCPNTGSSE